MERRDREREDEKKDREREDGEKEREIKMERMRETVRKEGDKRMREN